MAAAGEMVVTFPGGKKTETRVGNHVIRTDQPLMAGGEDSAPAPFSLFLASLVSCAGIYVISFCQKRGLSTDDIRIVQRTETDPETGTLSKVDLRVEVPSSFPEKYYDALVRSVEQCAVKRAIQAQPQITSRVTTTGQPRTFPGFEAHPA